MECHEKSVTPSLPDRSNHLHGCFKVEMGSSSGLSVSPRQLAVSIEVLCHQLAGTGSNQAGPDRLIHFLPQLRGKDVVMCDKKLQLHISTSKGELNPSAFSF